MQMFSRARFFLSFWLFIGLFAVPDGVRAEKLDPRNPPPNSTEREKKLGEQGVKEVESAKGIKLWDPKSSPEAQIQHDKLNAMARKLGAVSRRPKIDYTVKIIDSKEVNAFTLPDGKMYFYRGLIDFCANDDELAGVVAHEIGHNTLLHALRGQEKAKKLSWVNLAAMAAMLAGGQSGAGVGQFSQYVLVGIMNGYSVEYEKEADAEAVEMMTKGGYNPSALVTFMSRLQRREGDFGGDRLGIFQTHPATPERVSAARAQIEKAGLEFQPRAVSGGKRAQVQEAESRLQIKVGTNVLFEFANTTENAARAEQIAQKTDALLRANLALWEIVAKPNGELAARGQTLAKATEADAKLLGLTPAQTAQKWRENFQNLFWREQVSGKF